MLLRDERRARGRRCSTAVACSVDRARAATARIVMSSGGPGRQSRDHGTLGRRRQRPRRPAEAAARAARPSTHGANACWFRVQLARAGRRLVRPTRPGRRACRRRLRWLSTNHLMGAGYWVWLIPLGSGSTSFGIVADGDMHPFHRINRFERAMDWLREFEPQCAAIVVEAHAGAARGLSRAAALRARLRARVLAGSLGAGRRGRRLHRSVLLARIGLHRHRQRLRHRPDRARRRAARTISARAEAFNTTYLRLFDAFIRLYDGQYPIMGNAQVMTAKVSWDNACYWAITALLFFQRRLRQPEFIDVDRAADAALLRPARAHAAVLQRLGSRRRAASTRTPATSVVDVDFLRRLQASLGDGRRWTTMPLRDAARRPTSRCSKRSRAPGRRSPSSRHPIWRASVHVAERRSATLDVSARRLTLAGVPGV